MPPGPRPEACHCAGHRAILIFGPDTDNTIAAALSWAQTMKGVQHKFHYASGTSDRPKVPVAHGGWDNVRRPNTTIADTRYVGRNIRDCCFFEEILVMAHRHEPGINIFLANKLALLLQGRPVRKLTVWTCHTADHVYARSNAMGRYFEKICGLLVPRPCPCGCNLSLCDGRCHHPDGGPRAGYRCPDATESNKLYMAAWQDVPDGDHTHSILVKLGIDPGAADGRVLTSPDGRIRKTEIAPDGGCSTTVETGADVFGGIRVRADPILSPANPLSRPAIREEWRKRDTQARPPAQPRRYTGPIAAACKPSREGCLAGN